MRQSTLFPKTTKLPPAGEGSVNARLLEQAGFIKKHMAGVYSYLPLGLRVLRNVERRVRGAMDAIGGQEVYLPVLQPKELWETTGRWASLAPVMYQFRDHSDSEVGLGVTHEEVVASLLRAGVASYRELPVALYQIQTKFRHEPRARSGLLRCREFSMKDLYSCHATHEECDRYYERAAQAYLRLFNELGVPAKRVEASGGAFSSVRSHEFQVLCATGEDRILVCSQCDFAENSEIAAVQPGAACPACGDGTVETKHSIEVGNIFKLGTKYTEGVGAFFTDQGGAKKPIVMASYGIGVSRLVATIVEVHHDDKGMVWPSAVAPFAVHLLSLSPSGTAHAKAETLYALWLKEGIDVLFDDRDTRAGEKFADADLLGIPIQCIVSERTGANIEVRERVHTKKSELLAPAAVVKRFLK